MLCRRSRDTVISYTSQSEQHPVKLRRCLLTRPNHRLDSSREIKRARVVCFYIFKWNLGGVFSSLQSSSRSTLFEINQTYFVCHFTLSVILMLVTILASMGNNESSARIFSEAAAKRRFMCQNTVPQGRPVMCHIILNKLFI